MAKSISLRLTAGELRALQRLSYAARRSGGRKLSSSAILRALIAMMRSLSVDLKGVKTAAELRRRLLKAGLRPRRRAGARGARRVR